MKKIEYLTVRQIIEKVCVRFNQAGLFFGHGIDNAWDEAVTLVLHVLKLPWDVDEAELNRPLTENELQQIELLVDLRIQTWRPLAYLTHTAYFAGLSLYVDENVMIPRSPIAELIGREFSPWVNATRVHRILDLCTGSGCIAIACAKVFPHAIIDAVDIAESALKVAKINVEKQKVGNQVHLVHSDLFQALPLEKYDIIVSNPPYVSEAEMQTLPKEYYHEPEMAFRADENGLSIVLEILKEAPNFLADEGVLIVEVGNSKEALEKRLSHVPFIWLEFSHGGEGVFLLTKDQLKIGD